MSLSKALLCLGIIITTAIFNYQNRSDDIEELNAIIIEQENITSFKPMDHIQSVRKTCSTLGNTSKLDHQSIAQAVKDAAVKYDVKPELIVAVIATESRCQISAKSPMGAMGLMQLMPDTAKWLGVNKPYAIRENIMGGTKYLSYLLNRFDGNMPLALAAYNSGPETVRRYEAIPPYKETRHYVKKVLTHYRRLNIEGQKA